MAKVIVAPSVKKGRGRTLPVISSSSPAHVDMGGEEVNFPGEQKPAESPAQAHIDPRYIERLTEELEAAFERARVAEEQLAELRNHLDDERKSARESGYQEGFQKGRDQALAEQKKEIEAITTLLRSLSKEQVQLIERAEDAAVEIGFAATVKLLGRCSADHSLVAAMVKQAMRQVTEREGLVIRLSPADFQLLEQFRGQDENGLDWPDVELRADEQVGLGGCLIESRAGSLDARLELQMQELKRLLAAARARKQARS